MPRLSALEPASFPWFDYEKYTFSLGVGSGTKAWLSGHTASRYDADAKRIVIEGSPAQQVRASYAKIEAILGAAAMTLADVKRVVEYVPAHSLGTYAEAEAVRGEVFGEHRPAVNTVIVNELLRPAAVMEVEAVASREASQPVRISASTGRVAHADARAMEDVVYLSSLLPIDDDGSVVARGDLVGQTRFVFEKAERVLAAAGLTMGHVVKTVDYTTPATLTQYRHTGQVRREMLRADYPAAAGILVQRNIHPDALISLDVTASRHLPLAVNPGWDRYQKLTYSPAVSAGKMLFMSGQTALDPASGTALFPGDVVAQAEYAYQSILAVLEAAGAGPENLVKTIEYVTPAGSGGYRGVAAVRDRLLHRPFPASTGCVIELLLRPELLIEIDPLAILD